MFIIKLRKNTEKFQSFLLTAIYLKIINFKIPGLKRKVIVPRHCDSENCIIYVSILHVISFTLFYITHGALPFNW
jgi:hypothetical protein